MWDLRTTIDSAQGLLTLAGVHSSCYLSIEHNLGLLFPLSHLLTNSCPQYLTSRLKGQETSKVGLDTPGKKAPPFLFFRVALE